MHAGLREADFNIVMVFDPDVRIFSSKVSSSLKRTCIFTITADNAFCYIHRYETHGLFLVKKTCSAGDRTFYLLRHSRAGGNPERIEMTGSKSVLISRLRGNDGMVKYLGFYDAITI